jgi:DNA-binding NarL/FixJ family response regulator
VKTKSNPVTVLIVDDHAQYRRELRLVLELEDDIEVVGEAGDWHALWKSMRTHQPDVVLMDLRMPSDDGIKDGIDATRRIHREHPDSAVVIVTMLDDDEYAATARRAGAHAYVLKDSGSLDLLKAIHAIRRKVRPTNNLHAITVEHYSDL